jgi:hypothetical protein
MDGKQMEEKRFEFEVKRSELEMKQIEQNLALEPQLNTQEMVRRNLENLCLIWKTMNGSGGGQTPSQQEKEVLELVIKKFKEHVVKLSA